MNSGGPGDPLDRGVRDYCVCVGWGGVGMGVGTSPRAVTLVTTKNGRGAKLQGGCIRAPPFGVGSPRGVERARREV